MLDIDKIIQSAIRNNPTLITEYHTWEVFDQEGNTNINYNKLTLSKVPRGSFVGSLPSQKGRRVTEVQDMMAGDVVESIVYTVDILELSVPIRADSVLKITDNEQLYMPITPFGIEFVGKNIKLEVKIV